MVGARRDGVVRVLSALLVPSMAGWSITAAAADKAACVAAAEAAQHLRKSGQLVASRDQLLVCANPECPAVVSQDCTRWLGEVQRSIASVVVKARDARGQPIDDVRLVVDGTVLTEQATSSPIEVSPGEHVFRCERTGFSPASQRAQLAEGERGREIPCDMVAIAAVSETPPPAESHPAEASTGSSSSWSAIPVASWVLGGVGLAGLGLGTYFGVSEINDQHALEQPGQCGATTHNCDVSGIQTKIDLAYVSFGVGIVALGAAVVLAIVHAHESHGSASSAFLR